MVSESCKAIASLSQYLGNASWFGPAGAPEAIITALSKHSENITVQESAFQAIEGLCRDRYTTERLGDANVIEVILSAISKHVHHPHLLQLGCRALNELIRLGLNRAKTSHCLKHLCSVLTDGLTRHCDDLPSIFECSRVMVNLLKSISDDPVETELYHVSPAVVTGSKFKADFPLAQTYLGTMGACEAVGQIFKYLLRLHDDEVIENSGDGEAQKEGDETYILALRNEVEVPKSASLLVNATLSGGNIPRSSPRHNSAHVYVKSQQDNFDLSRIEVSRAYRYTCMLVR